MATLVVMLICPTAWAAEPNEPPIPLAFEIGPTTPGPLGASNGRFPGAGWQPLVFHKAVYAAAIGIVGPTEFLLRPGTARMTAFLDFAEEQAGLSARQKAFLEAARRVYVSGGRGVSSFSGRPIVLHPMVDCPDPNGPERVILYAVTLEDAKKMAQAYFQYAMTRFRGQVEGEDKALRELTGKIAQEEKRVSELDQLTETTQKSLDTLAKTVAYRTESEAQAAIGELDRMLNASQVEIAGVTAKIEAIQAYRQERREEGRAVPLEAAAKLNMMFIEESIALRGAEARKQMAVQLREQASRFLDIKSALASAAAERKTLTESLDADRRELPGRQKWLETAQQNEPKIPDKIVIYPVQWADAVPGNN